ncbi:MAG: acylneuraminate cytidylyltransferase family protein [Prevotella sp.]|nr:acylneuraminate cytidylyltransferase family protein [Bacteroides sp.]MCM1365919.1 acylneuraminate cytidylyltransferase family protein [Prevotella sp.]MCM1436660.1 acylneuraminate cytidylyltransferase family protein [Prevotella sp.]
MNCLVTVCARGGSKGIPGKNIKPVGGKPLLAYTAGIAKRFADKHGFDLAFSTDSDEIRKVGAEYGLPTDYVRPESLAGDVIGKPAAIFDLMKWAEKKYGKRYDYVLDLDVTSPIRTMEDIEKCLQTILSSPDAMTIFSVSPCGRNPYFNQVAERSDGYYGVATGDGNVTARQKAPKVYDINGSIYVYRRDALDCDFPKAISPKTLVYVMDHLCFDLDEPSDYDYLAYLLDTGKLKL